jgi:hypothetical protein
MLGGKQKRLKKKSKRGSNLAVGLHLQEDKDKTKKTRMAVAITAMTSSKLL